MVAADSDIIAAIATPPGRGGVGIIRISGKDLTAFFGTLIDQRPDPRMAHFCQFRGPQQEVLDQGLALYFPAPHSFTGENVLELHAHGGPVVMDMLLQRCLDLGARVARPGEFSERAFLNNKIDLAQAEAIADLIDASSRQAAQGAVKSLQGEFSTQVNDLVQAVIQLRAYVEAAIDFPDEEVDFLSEQKVADNLQELMVQLEQIFSRSQQGSLLREGISVVLTGKPNAGKSSLLNALSGKDSAIVTHIPGTTRDVLREYMHLDGMPLHLVDTAGIRDSDDTVEKEGIRRAWQEIRQADCILCVIDASQPFSLKPEDIWSGQLARQVLKEIDQTKIFHILNKVDLCEPGQFDHLAKQVIPLSAKTGRGMDQLKLTLKARVGYSATGEGLFSARRRHLEALESARLSLLRGQEHLHHRQGELLAEELRLAQNALSTITGEFTSDDLLGKIFSDFCIGK